MSGEISVVVPADHPAFVGHFPGFPILPGVLLLDEAMHAIEAATGLGATAFRIASAKFFSPVAPGETLLILHEILPSGSIRCDIQVGARMVASASLTPCEHINP